MIRKQDLETEAGNAEFEACCNSVTGFIRSKVFSQSDADDLIQETIKRVLQRLSDDETKEVNAGFFINTAKNVLREYYRKKGRLVSPLPNDDESNQLPEDEEQSDIHTSEEGRVVFNDCMMECFEERSLDEQVLLWRYSFDEKFRLDEEEPESYVRFFGTILSTLREIRDKFLPIQDEYLPLSEDKRVAISRLRKKLRECLENCIARKKGFA